MMASIIQIICLVFLIVPIIGAKVCPSGIGWLPYRSKCYNFIRNPRLSYANAVDICQNDGATVVSVNDAEEHKFIRDWLQKNDALKDTWWTSGLTTKSGTVQWQGDGTDSNYGVAWKIPPKEYMVDDAMIVYKVIDDQYGWAISEEDTRMSFICEISLDEVHRISQEDRDYDYGLNIPNPSMAPRGPSFLVEPESTVILGSTTMMFFDCVASGNPEPVFTWYKGDSNNVKLFKLGDRFTTTGGRLNILNPTEKDEGTYQCRASNVYGVILSRPATVSFGSLGDFSPLQVGTVYAAELHGAQLECPVITGSPGISYQWYKNSATTFIRPGKQRHTFVSATGKLFFSELNPSDEGTYYCMATLTSHGKSINYVGSSQTQSRTSVGFQLNVTSSGGNNYDPDIQNDFIFVYPRVPMRGQTIRLECFAYGTGPLKYTWSKKRGSFPSNRYQFRYDNRILIIRQVEMSDEDVYTCDVTSGKTKTSDTTTIELKIQADPFFIYPLNNQHVDIGGSLTWHCEAMGSPHPTYKWYKDGVELKGSMDGMTLSSNTLFIAKLDPKQNGMYQCAASNVLGTTFSSGQLRVLNVEPSFERSPLVKLINAALGGKLVIQCNPVGAPRPVITWTRNGNDLNLQPGIFSEEDNYRLMLNGDLVIMDVNQNDAGRFVCSAVNSEGKADDYSDVIVVEGVTFLVTPADDEVEVNLTAVLTCQAAYPKGRDIIYEWKFNDHIINFEREAEYSMGSGRQEGFLYVGPAQFQNEGWYTCSIVSALDRQSRSSYLTVNGPPREPTGVKVRSEPFESMDSSDDNINLDTTRWVTWMDSNRLGIPSSHYFIQFSTNFDTAWRVHPDGNNIPAARTKNDLYPETRIIRLTDLKAGAAVQFRVIGRNAYGVGTPSLPTGRVQIPGAIPTQQVKNVRGGGGSEGDLTIAWDPLPEEDHNGPDFKYKVRWRLKVDGDSSGSAQWRDDVISQAGACEDEFTFDYGFVFICHFVTTVGPEKFYTPYQVQVIGKNKYGEGPASNMTIVMSAENMPSGVPGNVKAEVFNATALMVTWKPVRNTRVGINGRLKGYKINYWRRGNETEREARQKPIALRPGQTNLDRGLIIGLVPVQWYKFNVQVYNHAGNGPKSETYEQQTLNKAPGLFPTEVHVFSVEGDGVRVNFRGISTLQREEPLLGYKAQVWRESENIRSANDYDFGRMSTGVIRNLTNGIVYRLRVFGYSRAGQGERSSPSIYFTVGGGEMRINPETTEITSSGSCLTPSLIAALFIPLLAGVRFIFHLFS